MRTALVKQLASDGGVWLLVGILVNEWAMSFLTNRAVALRIDRGYLHHIDHVWATGAMLGCFLGVFTVHVVWHVGREDPKGCLMSFLPF